MLETDKVPKVLLSEQEGEAAMLKQAVKAEAEISSVVLAELSEKARTAGNSGKADHLLLLAWTAYDEAEKLQSDVGPCSSKPW